MDEQKRKMELGEFEDDEEEDQAEKIAKQRELAKKQLEKMEEEERLRKLEQGDAGTPEEGADGQDK